MPEVKIRMPGSAVTVTYTSRVERDRALLMAEARQPGVPAWGALTDDEREYAALEARDWVRAAVACGLMPEGED